MFVQNEKNDIVIRNYDAVNGIVTEKAENIKTQLKNGINGESSVKVISNGWKIKMKNGDKFQIKNLSPFFLVITFVVRQV